MKNSILVLAMIVLTGGAETAAQEIHFFGSLGYGLGRGGNNAFRQQVFLNDEKIFPVEDLYLSIGEGVKLDGGIQAALGKYVGVRVSGGYSRTISQEAGADEFDASLVHVDALLMLRSAAGSGQVLAHRWGMHLSWP